jgi:tetratricopeptide (TPR) repeat protein
VALDPQNLSFLDSIARNYRAQRRFEEALATLDRAITLAPDNADLYDAKSEILLATGSIVAARDVLVRAPVTEPMHLAWFSVDLYDRRWEAILERADRVPQEDQFPRLAADYYGGVALLQLGRTEEGRDVLQTLAGVFEGLVAEGGQRWSQHLGEVCSLLGRYEDAVAQAERAIEFWAEDHLLGPDQEETLAWIHAHAGEVEPAVAIFDRLLAIPYGYSITVDDLHLDPRADPIRDDPRFQALLEKYGQDAS